MKESVRDGQVIRVRDSRCMRRGTVLLMVVFIVALLATMVVGILQVNTEDIQIANNHVGMAEARAIAEAGIQHAISRKRQNPNWSSGFSNRRFAGGQYTVNVEGWQLESTGQSAKGYKTRVVANITVLGDTPPHTIRIDSLRINP